MRMVVPVAPAGPISFATPLLANCGAGSRAPCVGAMQAVLPLLPLLPPLPPLPASPEAEPLDDSPEPLSASSAGAK